MKQPLLGSWKAKYLARGPINSTDPAFTAGFAYPPVPSYRVFGNEMDSPRGRIHTLKAVERGEIPFDATVASHFDTCLGCLACVSACPSGVRYDELLEATRPKLNAPELRSPWQRGFASCCSPCCRTPTACATALAAAELQRLGVFKAG